ncbi:MAG: ClbS/DfsB family four-helix bundle protein [Herpetosiphonaceae bacterium]|nr:ClbS/DfsB family four-helix bundle protein [Herpetosiphonaceae bacterium]
MTQNAIPDEQQAEQQSKTELLASIDQGWSHLEQTIHSLNDSQLTTLRDTQGWSVKDHLVHITAWEQSLLALLEGRNRDQAMGLDDTQNRSMESDEVNNIIYQHNRERSLADVQAALERSHAEVVAAISGLSDADLRKPYSHYQPDDLPSNSDPVVGWIIGNTYEHYDEHAAWIQTLAG